MTRWLVIALPFLLVAAPFALRPAPEAEPQRQVVVITPHGEAIRAEFGRAFARWSERELGEPIGVDWRTPGGTSDIVRYLDDQFRLAVLHAHGDAEGFNDTRRDTPARRAFLAGSAGIGLDVFFGGGEFQHRAQADKGYLVDAGLRIADQVPEMLSGERMWDPAGRYYGACLSVFGVAVHAPRLDPAQVTGWAALADPRLRRGTTLADPTKSGVITTVFERVIQVELARAAADPAHPTATELERGWQAAWTVLKGIAGNARSITDGASRAVRDVARGEAAAGMCIDFHARAEADWIGSGRLAFVTPVGETSYSADPIALIRGGPNPELGRAFIRFVLSVEGQRLWNYRPGAPGGPQRYALRRLPIRRDLYAPEHRAHMSDPDEDPYAIAAAFTYRPALTGHLFTLIAPFTKAILLDPRDELRLAWEAIHDAGGPAQVPAAWAAFTRLPVGYADAPDRLKELRAGPATALPLLRAWTLAARDAYREAAALAAEGR